MSHSYVPTLFGVRRLALAVTLAAAVAAGAVGAELVDRIVAAPADATSDVDPFAIERARAERYVEWLEDRAQAAEGGAQR